MSNVKKWTVNGNDCTTEDLAQQSPIPFSVIAARLRDGWDVQAAITVPVKPKMITEDAAKICLNGPVDIVFTSHIPEVFAHMQPILYKRYTATPHCANSEKQKAKLYYIIKLDNGEPLIVYPGEFELLDGTAIAA